MNTDNVRDITPAELHARMRAGFNGTILDVREDHEIRETGVVPGAIHIPLGALPVRMGELPPNRPVVVVCRSGRRSLTAAGQLLSVGIPAENLAGGMLVWLEEKLPIERR
jgi:rhodanese-related sulfurtransferase